MRIDYKWIQYAMLTWVMFYGETHHAFGQKLGTDTGIQTTWTISGSACSATVANTCISSYTQTFVPPSGSTTVVTIAGNLLTYVWRPGGSLYCGTWNISLAANWLDPSGKAVASAPATVAISEPCPFVPASPNITSANPQP